MAETTDQEFPRTHFSDSSMFSAIQCGGSCCLCWLSDCYNLVLQSSSVLCSNSVPHYKEDEMQMQNMDETVAHRQKQRKLQANIDEIMNGEANDDKKYIHSCARIIWYIVQYLGTLYIHIRYIPGICRQRSIIINILLISHCRSHALECLEWRLNV